jgi:formylglycine-generating enzyme required for sulfatase activity
LLFADVRRDVIRRSNGAQTPETSDSLDGRFAFSAAVVLPAGPAADDVAWSFLKDAGSADLLRRFIADYPASPHRREAEERLTMVLSVRPAEPPPASLQSRAAPLTPAQERGLKPKDTFRECAHCPEMVVVPAGSFTMGSPDNEEGRWDDSESPQHVVTIGKPFAVGKLHVTVDQFKAFVDEMKFNLASCWRDPGFAQEGSHPVVCVTWDDAQAYTDWVSQKTGMPYRLLSEAEWEYAARGRTSPEVYPRFWFGNNDELERCRFANGEGQCDGFEFTSPAGYFPPNAFGLFDMAGNAWQWTADCWHSNYNGAPSDGSAWTATCRNNGHVTRGSSWDDFSRDLRAARRSWFTGGVNRQVGFRLARTLISAGSSGN